jgi:hypothetical protein
MEAAKDAVPLSTSQWVREVLVLAARTQLDASQRTALAEMCGDSRLGDAAWRELLQLANRHAVAPLLFWSLKSIEWKGVPSDARADLEQVFQINAARSFSLSRELVRVSRLLREHGVKMVSFKGPTLAGAMYGSVALRRFGDLDLLVPRSQVRQARQVLLEDAYHLRVPMRQSEEEAHLRTESVFDLVRDDPPILVELHWGVTSRCFARPITFEHVEKTLANAPLLGSDEPHLGAEELLLILCVHGTKHLWERLQWIADVNELLQRHTHLLDWKRVLALAHELRVERMLFLGLAVAHDVLQAPLPQEVLATARADSPVPALAAVVCRRLFEGAPVSPIQSSRFLMRCMDSWGDRARFVAHIAFTTPPDHRTQVLLPGPLERLRPLVRLASLIAPGRLVNTPQQDTQAQAHAEPRTHG